jgi:hypothetical protein
MCPPAVEYTDQYRVDIMLDQEKFNEELISRVKLIEQESPHTDHSLGKFDFILSIVFGVALPLLLLIWAWLTIPI